MVREMAKVRLNGKDLGVVWCPPWRVEITDAAQPGENVLEIDVVNLWPNRLIGDGKLPPEKRLTKTNVLKFYNLAKQGEEPLWESGLLGPVTLATTDPPKEIAVDVGGGVKMEMVLVPAGEFIMGSPDSDLDAQHH